MPVTTSVVAPAPAAPWHVRQSSFLGALRSIAPWAVWARWQPAQLSAVSELTPEFTDATWGPPSARHGNRGEEQPGDQATACRRSADRDAADLAARWVIASLLGRIGGSSSGSDGQGM